MLYNCTIKFCLQINKQEVLLGCIGNSKKGLSGCIVIGEEIVYVHREGLLASIIVFPCIEGNLETATNPFKKKFSFNRSEKFSLLAFYLMSQWRWYGFDRNHFSSIDSPSPFQCL